MVECCPNSFFNISVSPLQERVNEVAPICVDGKICFWIRCVHFFPWEVNCKTVRVASVSSRSVFDDACIDKPESLFEIDS